MNDESNAHGGAPFRFANGDSPDRARSTSSAMGRAVGNGNGPASAKKAAPQFGAADLLPFVGALGRRWKWLLSGGVVM